MALSVVVPAWNEREGIAHMVAAALVAADDVAARPRHGVARIELVVVDDGSTDGTPDLVRRLAELDERVVLICHDRNRGLGAAIRTGIRAASGDLVLYTDADLPVDLCEIDTVLSAFEANGVSMVAARRTSSGADGLRRHIYQLGYDQVVRWVLGLRVSDVNFAFKLFDRRLAESLHLRSEGSFIDAELLARFDRSGLPWCQVEVDYQRRRFGRSSLSTLPVIAKILLEMLRLRRGLRRAAPGRDRDTQALRRVA